MIRHFIHYYKPHWKLFTLDMIAAFIVAVCDLFYPIIAGNIINDYVPNQQVRLLLIWAGVLLLIYLVKAGLNWFIQYWGHVVGVRMQGDMRRDVFAHLQKLPFSFFDEHKTGSIMSRIINDMMDISELAHHGPEDLFISLISLIGAFVILCSINIPLTLIIFAIIPFIVLFSIKMRTSMNDAFKRTREEIAEVNASVENSIAGIRVSRAYTGAEIEQEKFDKNNEMFQKVRARAYKMMAHFFSGMGLFTDLLYLLVLVAGGLFYYDSRITTGEFVQFLLFISMFLNPIKRLVQFYEQLQNGMTGFARFRELMEVQPEDEDPDAIELTETNGAITFDDVSFRYENLLKGEDSSSEDKTELVIDHLTLHIESGKTVALVGPSGGGKTTLCHLIPRFYEVTDGKITLDGTDIRKFSRQSLRSNIGIVAQDVFLFTGTIRDNIAYGRLDATEAEIEAAAKSANIHDYILTLPQGYDTYVGERGVKLSGGQKQRISIARMFLKDPAILILDEATSALDNATEMLIQNALEKLAKGRTCIVVAHRLSTIKNADQIVVLSDEGILEEGDHDTLLQQNGVYAKLYQYQFKTV